MGKWLKRIIKAFVAICCILLVWRVLFAESESVLGDFTPTKATADDYKADESITVLTNKVTDDISEGGYFSAYAVYYTPETKELQVTVRYNDNTTDVLGDIGFCAYTVDTSVAPIETETSDATDESVSISSDRKYHEGYPIGEFYTPECIDSTEKLFYNYEKLVFEGVEINEGDNFIISLYNEGDQNNEKAVIVVHFAEQTFENYRLSGSEKKALSAYKE